MQRGFFDQSTADSWLRKAVASLCWLLLACSAAADNAAPADQAANSSADLTKARAFWLSADTLAWPVDASMAVSLQFSPTASLELTPAGLKGGEAIPLQATGAVNGELAERFPHLAGLQAFRLPVSGVERAPEILKSQLVLSASSPDGLLQDAAAIQHAGVLDELFTWNGPLGVTFDDKRPFFRLWAPTARSVKLLIFDSSDPEAVPAHILPMNEDTGTGTWALQGKVDWSRKFYLYEVEVFVRRTGRFETNHVTDPYSHSLSMDSRRSQVVNLDDSDLVPEGWAALKKPPFGKPEDTVLYELHVRDFSISDATVPVDDRGTFRAFAQTQSNGMRHLLGLAESGLSHAHLLPVFDCATIPENPLDRKEPGDLSALPPDSPLQQQAVDKVRARDAFNWCYDPYHYTVPEGSYATDPDGVARILEFRQMVAALNRSGLRVVMDVVYNHTTTAGQAQKSVLDRIVPDYYQRLDSKGDVEKSTCCSNTATEHAMMEKLMVDSLLTWAVQYKVDSFRFDLMGHHSKANILKVQEALWALTPEEHGVNGSEIYLYGEGWDFGEVAGDARFVQATQKHMGSGTGVGTFNDRLRDAVRGGAHDDEGITHLQTQGFINGLFYAPNSENSGSAEERDRLLHFTDLVRVGLAGSLADFEFGNRFGERVRASEIDYEGQPAGYTSDPQEAINYIAAHDNETLFDINQYKLPADTTLADRVRVVNLANSIIALAQGVPFFHAGQDMLRSKSLDSNSFDSGDWFNLLDFSYQSNGWARGLPPAWDNEANWAVAGPILADSAMAPGTADIQAARRNLGEMLQIRSASSWLRLGSAAEVRDSLEFLNTGPGQVPGLIVMSLGDEAGGLVVLFNATVTPQRFTAQKRRYELHPIQQASADPVVRGARYDAGKGEFHVPPRTTAVFVHGE